MKFRPLSHFSAAALLALGLAPILFSQTPGASLTLLSREGRRPIPLTLVGDQEFVALDDLAPIFQLTVQESLGAITVSYRGRTIVLTPDQTLASVAGRLISLPAPPARAGRRWLVPVEFISRALAPIADTPIDFRKPSRLLILGGLRVPRVVVRHESTATTARLIVDATPPANSTVAQENEHLTIRFDADALDLQIPALPPAAATSIIQGIRSVDALTIGVDVAPRTVARSIAQPVDNTMRTVIDLTAAQTETGAAPPPSAAPALAPPLDLPPSFGQPAGIRTVAIDPGHGGNDQGAVGGGGTKEKDLTLAVARRLKVTLEARLGVRVLMTRDDDRDVPSDDRTALANNNKADLFVSLHANASMRKTAAGATIYSAAFDEDASKSASGNAERVPAFGGGLRDIEMVPWDLAQTHHLEKSTAFAALLEDQLKDRVPLAARAADRAPLRVLESANMPAVLVELGYLSNPDQEKLIASDAFQHAFVQAFYDAVVRFRDTRTNGGGGR